MRPDLDALCPSPGDIAVVFAAHHAHHRGLPLDVVSRDRGSEQELSKDYAGRVIFELFQNAVDRAEHEIWIEVEPVDGGHILRVANDGRPFEMNPAFRPDAENQDRKDFHALCSLHTSAKHANRAIGNKGVGFRSVFTLGPRAAVWSRVRGGGWWGLELVRSSERPLATPAHHDGAALIAALGPTGAHLGPRTDRAHIEFPSFYFPSPLYAPEGDALLTNGLAPPAGAHTVVEVPTGSTPANEVLRYLNTFACAPLHFVHLRYPKKAELRIHVRGLGLERERRIVPEGGWTVVAFPGEPDSREAAADAQTQDRLADLAGRADHPVNAPRVAIAFPPEVADPRVDEKSVLVGYLPTTSPAGFGVQVQADFLLGTARTQVTVGDGDGSHVERFNRALLAVAGDLLVRTLSGGPSKPDCPGTALSDRDDLFRFLRPSAERAAEAAPFADAVGLALGFEPYGSPKGWSARDWCLWAKLARGHFGTGAEPRIRPLSSYRYFWEATAAWIERVPYRDYKNRPGKAARDLALGAVLDALRAEDAAVVPAVQPEAADDAPVRAAESLPARWTQGSGHASRRVFVRENDGGPAAPMPAALRDVRRLVTHFAFFPDLLEANAAVTGLSRWDRWELLAELRQAGASRDEDQEPVPPGSAALDSDASAAIRSQGEVLRYAHTLWRFRGRNEPTPQEDPTFQVVAWRASAKDRRRDAGRALASLFLPVRGGSWLPAAQVVVPGPSGDAPWLVDAPSTVGVLDRETLAGLLRSEIAEDRVLDGAEVEAFALFLGCAGFLPLLERGRAATVLPHGHPPGLASGEAPRVAPYQWLVRPSDLIRTGAPQDAPSAACLRARACIILDAVRVRLGWRGVHDLASIPALGGNLLDSLILDEWFPVGDVPSLTPGGLPLARAAGGRVIVAPSSLVLKTGRGGVRTDALPELSAPAHSEDLRFVQELSILPVNDVTPPWKLRYLLDELASAAPPAVGAPHRHRFRELFGALIDRLLPRAEGDDLHEVPLLCAVPASAPQDPERAPTARETVVLDRRQWAWARPGDSVGSIPPLVLALRPDHVLVERIFPDLPVLVVPLDHAPALIAAIGLGRPEVSQVVRPDEAGGRDAPATDLLAGIAPALLAVAEAEGLLNGPVDPDRAARNWERARVVRVRDTWIEHSVSWAGKRFVRTERQAAYEDVFTRGFRTGDAPADTVLFDVPPDSPSDSLPPLHHFGRAMAEILVVNQACAPAFEHALSLAQMDLAMPAPSFPGPALTRLLDRSGAQLHLDRMTTGFCPLDPSRARELCEHLSRVIAGAGLDCQVLRDGQWLGVLTPHEFVCTRSEARQTRERDLERGLREVCRSIGLDSWAPDVQFSATHRETLQRWLGEAHRTERLRAWVMAESEDQADARALASARLDSGLAGPVMASHTERLGFDPAAATLAVLADVLGRDLLLRPDEFDGALPEWIAPRVETIVSAADAGWTGTPLPESRPAGGPGEVISPEDREKEDRARRVAGRAAEEAMLPCAVERSSGVLTIGRSAWAVLESALPVNRRGTALLAAARAAWAVDPGSRETGQALRSLLHVADWRENAGYDIMTLEQTEGVVRAVRWEVKSVGAKAPRELFVSTNELAVARYVLLPGACPAASTARYAGGWMLLAVPRGAKDAVDVTSLLSPLLAGTPSGPLRALADLGVRPESLMLRMG